MRTLFIIFYSGFILSFSSTVLAQDIAMNANSSNPFYDYTESALTNVGTIPDYDSKEEEQYILVMV